MFETIHNLFCLKIIDTFSPQELFFFRISSVKSIFYGFQTLLENHKQKSNSDTELVWHNLSEQHFSLEFFGNYSKCTQINFSPEIRKNFLCLFVTSFCGFNNFFPKTISQIHEITYFPETYFSRKTVSRKKKSIFGEKYFDSFFFVREINFREKEGQCYENKKKSHACFGKWIKYICVFCKYIILSKSMMSPSLEPEFENATWVLVNEKWTPNFNRFFLLFSHNK